MLPHRKAISYQAYTLTINFIRLPLQPNPSQPQRPQKAAQMDLERVSNARMILDQDCSVDLLLPFVRLILRSRDVADKAGQGAAVRIAKQALAQPLLGHL
jgi:hypothetical protein